MKVPPYVYCIIRISKKEFKWINHDLLAAGYKDIKSIVPTLKIESRDKKGGNVIKRVPLLFNYGFLKIRKDKAMDRIFIKKLSKRIKGILGFVKSPETLHEKKKRARIDNIEDFDDFSIPAFVTVKEVNRYIRVAKKNNVYSKEDITLYKAGDWVQLKKYPLKGVMAQIEDINLNRKEVSVLVYPERGGILVKLPFSSIMTSAYDDYDEDILMASQVEVDFSRVSS